MIKISQNNNQKYWVDEKTRHEIEDIFKDESPKTLAELEKEYSFEEIQNILYCPTVDKMKKYDRNIWIDFRLCKHSINWRTIDDRYTLEKNFVMVYNGLDKKEVSGLMYEKFRSELYDNIPIEDVPELKKYVKGI